MICLTITYGNDWVSTFLRNTQVGALNCIKTLPEIRSTLSKGLNAVISSPGEHEMYKTAQVFG